MTIFSGDKKQAHRSWGRWIHRMGSMVRSLVKWIGTKILFIDKRLIVFTHDVFWATCALPMALWLRLGGDMAGRGGMVLLKHTAVYGLLGAGSFLIFRLYRGVWRYASVGELSRLAMGASLQTITYVPLMVIMSQTTPMPRSAPPIAWGLVILLLGGSRFAYRLYHDWISGSVAPSRHGADQTLKPLILIGANHEAELFLRDIGRHNPFGYVVLGLLDDNKSRKGRLIHDCEILGAIQDLKNVLTAYHAQKKIVHGVVITDASFKGEKLRALMDQVESSPYPHLKITRLPKRTQLTTGTGGAIEPISLDDLLNRPEIQLNLSLSNRFIKGRRILITGAGGTIGGELCRQVAALEPAALGFLDHSEHLLYTIHRTIIESHPNLPLKGFYGDVVNRGRVGEVFQDFQPDVVFHAAALKHVPIAEDHLLEALETNTLGAKNVADGAAMSGAAAMIFISTDKAVHPTNIMGATKRLAEHYCQVLDNDPSIGTRYITTRFGNVLGSNGSVVPLFQRQIAEGGPITVTDPHITRYFMSVKEAVELVLEAAAMGYDIPKQRGVIYVLDMGKAVRIDDLARKMAHLSGLKVGTDIQIVYTGLRAGEKLYEELFYDHEELQPTPCAGLLMAAPKALNRDYLDRKLDLLRTAVQDRNVQQAFHLLQALVPDYTPYDQTVHRLKEEGEMPS